MRKSRVLDKLREGKTVSCVKLNIADAQVSALASMCGFDCVWVDTEHMAIDWSAINSHIWASKAHDVDIMVRVGRGSYSDYIKPLELDATGILVPHIMSLEDAKQVIHMTRFHPIGRRPIDGGGADGGYTNLDFKQYLQQANDQRFVSLQIEDPEPLDQLEAIAALEGFDMLFFGPGDFSQGIGAPGDWTNTRLTEARKYVAEVAVRHGKIAATTGSIDSLPELIAMGYKFVNVGADIVGLSNYFHQLVGRFNTEPSTGANTNQSIYK